MASSSTSGRPDRSPRDADDAAPAAELSDVLKALAHPVRLAAVRALSSGERCVSELGAELGVRQPLLSQQLTVLRGAHVVTTRRAAKQVFYRLTPGKLDPLRGLFSAIHEGSAPGA